MVQLEEVLGTASGPSGSGAPDSVWTRATAAGSRFPATSRACRVSAPSGPETERAAPIARAASAAIEPRASSPKKTSVRVASDSSSPARAVMSLPSELCTVRRPLMVEVADSYQAVAGMRAGSRP